MTEKDRIRIEIQETLRLFKNGCAVALAVILIGILAMLGVIHIITIL